MAEQTKFFTVQRGAPRSFKPVSNGVINLYLYINIHTDGGRKPETIFGCSLCKTHPCNKLCFMRKFITLKKCSPAHLNAVELNVKNKRRWQYLEVEEDGIPYSKWCQKSLVALPEQFPYLQILIMVFQYSHCQVTGTP